MKFNYDHNDWYENYLYAKKLKFNNKRRDLSEPQHMSRNKLLLNDQPREVDRLINIDSATTMLKPFIVKNPGKNRLKIVTNMLPSVNNNYDKQLVFNYGLKSFSTKYLKFYRKLQNIKPISYNFLLKANYKTNKLLKIINTVHNKQHKKAVVKVANNYKLINHSKQYKKAVVKVANNYKLINHSKTRVYLLSYYELKKQIYIKHKKQLTKKKNLKIIQKILHKTMDWLAHPIYYRVNTRPYIKQVYRIRRCLKNMKFKVKPHKINRKLRIKLYHSLYSRSKILNHIRYGFIRPSYRKTNRRIVRRWHYRIHNVPWVYRPRL